MELFRRLLIFNPFSIYFASKKGSQHALLSHIDAHLSEWKRDRNSIYYKKLGQWLGGLHGDRPLPTWIIYSLFFTVFTALLLSGFSLLLKKKVKQKTLELRESHELLENLASMVPGFLYQYQLFSNGHAAFPYASPGITDIYEIELKDVREDANIIWQRVHPDDRPQITETLLESVRTLNPFFCEFRVILPKQGLCWRRSQAQPQSLPDGSTLWHGITSDITKHKLAEQALRASEEDLKESQRIAHVGTWRLDLENNEVVWSEELYRMYGFDPHLPPPPYTEHSKLFTPESWQQLSAALKNTEETGVPYDLELNTRRVDGSLGWMWVHGMTIKNPQGKTIGLRGVAQDISDRKTAEGEKKKMAEQLQQAQKMEAIGTLAGGIAHDFNNILSVILGFAELARDGLPADSAAASDIDQVILAGTRAKDLVKQILAFSRQAQSNLIPLNPAVTIKETLKLLRASLPTTITIVQEIDPDPGLVLADPTHLHQIMMNLCTNAFHAMETEGGLLTVKLRKQDESPNGETFIVLSIIDTGAGIAPDILEKIFEPYFTTKEPGKGTGMGLAVIHGIVESYGGFVSCESRPGVGSAFHITLPTTSIERMDFSEPAETHRHNKEHILLIDDEEILLEMNAKILEGLGFRVTTINSSNEALSTFLAQPDAFDLVITDQTMPGMTGIDISSRILQIRPEIPIILCTGYSSLISEEKAKAIGIKEFAYKPISKSEISKLVARVFAN